MLACTLPATQPQQAGVAAMNHRGCCAFSRLQSHAKLGHQLALDHESHQPCCSVSVLTRCLHLAGGLRATQLADAAVSARQSLCHCSAKAKSTFQSLMHQHT